MRPHLADPRKRRRGANFGPLGIFRVCPSTMWLHLGFRGPKRRRREPLGGLSEPKPGRPRPQCKAFWSWGPPFGERAPTGAQQRPVGSTRQPHLLVLGGPTGSEWSPTKEGQQGQDAAVSCSCGPEKKLKVGGPCQARGDIVGFDIGNVLSAKDTSVKHEGDQIYRSCTDGAYACLFFCVAIYGAENVVVISKTNTGSWTSEYKGRSQDHWCVKFLRQIGLFDLGVPESNVEFVTKFDGPGGKGPPAASLEVSHFVDDNMRCGKAIQDACPDAVWVHFDASKSGRYPTSTHGPGSEGDYYGCKNFWEVMTAVGLTDVPGVTLNLYYELGRWGPPRVPHDPANLDWLLDKLEKAALEYCDIGSPTDVPDSAVEPPRAVATVSKARARQNMLRPTSKAMIRPTTSAMRQSAASSSNAPWRQQQQPQPDRHVAADGATAKWSPPVPDSHDDIAGEGGSETPPAEAAQLEDDRAGELQGGSETELEAAHRAVHHRATLRGSQTALDAAHHRATSGGSETELEAAHHRATSGSETELEAAQQHRATSGGSELEAAHYHHRATAGGSHDVEAELRSELRAAQASLMAAQANELAMARAEAAAAVAALDAVWGARSEVAEARRAKPASRPIRAAADRGANWNEKKRLRAEKHADRVRAAEQESGGDQLEAAGSSSAASAWLNASCVQCGRTSCASCTNGMCRPCCKRFGNDRDCSCLSRLW